LNLYMCLGFVWTVCFYAIRQCLFAFFFSQFYQCYNIIMYIKLACNITQICKLIMNCWCISIAIYLSWLWA
jgi:hypothetical protein